MTRIITLMAFLAFSISLFGQTAVADEVFNLTFLETKSGGKWLFKNSNRSFSISVVAKTVTTTESPNYIIADDAVLQASIVPLPKSNMDFSKLTMPQQKQILTGYVDYELTYFQKELKIQYKNVQKEWVMMNNQLWLIWIFDSGNLISNEELKSNPKKQIYASTICFNQVLDLNIPVMENKNAALSRGIINNLMTTLTF